MDGTWSMIHGMADFGDLKYIEAAVQVIPVMVIAVVVDPIHRDDAASPVHRAHASASALVGLMFGIAGEIAGLQALLTDVSAQTLPLVSGGIAALAATALLPRLAQLIVPARADAARRVTNVLLPTIVGGVGLVASLHTAPLALRLVIYALLGISLIVLALTAVNRSGIRNER